MPRDPLQDLSFKNWDENGLICFGAKNVLWSSWFVGVAALPSAFKVFYDLVVESWLKCDENTQVIFLRGDILAYKIRQSSACANRNKADATWLRETALQLFHRHEEGKVPNGVCWVGHDRTKTQNIAVSWGFDGHEVETMDCNRGMKGADTCEIQR